MLTVEHLINRMRELGLQDLGLRELALRELALRARGKWRSGVGARHGSRSGDGAPTPPKGCDRARMGSFAKLTA
jgi:hypothetical protein